jgi:hypothetical protein
VKAFCLSVDPYLESCSSRRRDLGLGSLQARTMLEVKRYLYYAEALRSVVREIGNDGTPCYACDSSTLNAILNERDQVIHYLASSRAASSAGPVAKQKNRAQVR